MRKFLSTIHNSRGCKIIKKTKYDVVEWWEENERLNYLFPATFLSWAPTRVYNIMLLLFFKRGKISNERVKYSRI